MTETPSQREKLLLILESDPQSAVLLAEILAPPISIRPPK